WQVGTGENQNRWTCLACGDGRWHLGFNAKKHESSSTHKRSLSHWQQRIGWTPPNPLEQNSRVSALVREPLVDMITTLRRRSPSPMHVGNDPDIDMSYPSSQSASPDHIRSEEQYTIACLAIELESYLLDDGEHESSASEQELDERDLLVLVLSKCVLDQPEDDVVSFGQRRARSSNVAAEHDPYWFPWADKAACILDLFRHLPRSIFSDAQMEVVTWALSAFGIDNVPSVSVMKSVDAYLQSLCGIRTIRYEGALGHIYYMNDLAGIIRQEMANPRVRPHIHHYYEDSGRRLEHVWQAEAWRDLDPKLATPMIRINNQDFYTYEITRLDNGELVIPHRWFIHHQDPDSTGTLNGMGWKLKPDHRHHGYVVCEWDEIRFTSKSLLVPFPRLVEQYNEDGLYDPRQILGLFSTQNDSQLIEWTYTSSAEGYQNAWRVKAKGHRVLTFAMWLYCDNTSGNVSKKWNKHNSFLFTAAGLPQEHVHRQSNIHFLSTSNLAPPLEMLDGLVEQLSTTQRDGIWAWDIEAQEMVLMVPAVLAMLGDNPMQSEFACHVGLAGKYFCRCCWVKGRDAEDENPLPQTTNAETGSTHSNASSDGSTGRKHRRRRPETLSELCERAKRFLIVCALGHIYYMNDLAGIIRQVSTSRLDKQLKVNEYVQNELPENIYSPVWRIKGIDPHRDTPVEILHVILLGFVKYYWRDAIARL
ncbi:hypothetical protein EV361DRAFT_769198, partial [Lentinula raphanica]